MKIYGFGAPEAPVILLLPGTCCHWRANFGHVIPPLPDKIDAPGTEIHIFYALKMGEKYRARYAQHFACPIIHQQDMQHEELLACYPEEWAQLVKRILRGERTAP